MNLQLNKIHHVGIAVKDMEKASRFILDTHAITHDSGIVHDPLLKAHLRLFTVEDGFHLELVEGEAVSAVLKKGMTYYHNCYEVKNLDDALKNLKNLNCLTVIPPTPAVLFDGRKVAFVLSPLGLIELLETL